MSPLKPNAAIETEWRFRALPDGQQIIDSVIAEIRGLNRLVNYIKSRRNGRNETRPKAITTEQQPTRNAPVSLIFRSFAQEGTEPTIPDSICRKCGQPASQHARPQSANRSNRRGVAEAVTPAAIQATKRTQIIRSVFFLRRIDRGRQLL